MPSTQPNLTFRTISRSALIAFCQAWQQRDVPGAAHYMVPGDLPPPRIASTLPARVLDAVRSAPAGAGLLLGGETGLLVLPPFPFEQTASYEARNAAPLAAMLARPRVVAAVAVRLGRYGVAVYEDERMVVSKVGARFVKNRNRKGGSSSGRFARRREEQAKALFDKVCEVCGDVLTPHMGVVEHLILAGEAQTLRGFEERCDLIRRMASRRLPHVLNVREPSHEAMEQLPKLIYQSRIAEFAPLPFSYPPVTLG